MSTCSLANCRATMVRAVVALTFAWVAADAIAGQLDFTVSPQQVIYTVKQRTDRKLNYWPDGNFGVVNNGNGTYDFYAANSSAPVKTTTASLTDPGLNKQAVTISGLPANTFNYVSGGPVYRDAASGARVMVYHAEKHFGSSQNYYTVLGLAVATDTAGVKFRDLGTIIEPNAAAGQLAQSIDIGGGSFAVVNNYLNVYYRDYMANGASSELSVARAPLADVVSNALAGRYTQFWKYYNGNWSEQGVRGMASPLENGNPGNSWSSVSYNDYLNQVVMVSSQWIGDGGDLFMATSPDGVNWSPRQSIAVQSGEQFYPSIVGTGTDASRTGQSFYVYYTDSQKGAWNRWSDANLARRTITFGSANPTQPPPTPNPTTWTTVSDYASDFQIGNPGDGWKYAWSSTGKIGNSATFSPLVWSNTAQAYNTTGGLTQEPGNSTHGDDYLLLTGNGGHPGRPGYLPIAGYTIQADDGAGLYRLAQSSISKTDGTTVKNEDGLEVYVYLNNTMIGSYQPVSTNGALASFNRDLGNLNVGDTVWVMVNSGINNNYDLFNNFDFSIQRSGSVIPAPTPNPAPAPAPATTWATISNYVANFQIGNPAAGWKYAWSSTGKLGNSSTFTPLIWSDVAQAYNTTGGATQEPGKITHGDDYMFLASYGGHPGRPGFLPIAGYTIQAADGDGLYRLAETLISKADGTTAKNEDGLEVYVYLNNTMIGTYQTVSANGSLANFDRDLGNLKVGDTVWVMVNSGNNNNYDLFNNFNFSIQKLVSMPLLFQASAVPEPSTISVCVAAMGAFALRRRKRGANAS